LLSKHWPVYLFYLFIWFKLRTLQFPGKSFNQNILYL
jgi:hypothetical protein